jgi:hypothetical protein
MIFKGKLQRSDPQFNLKMSDFDLSVKISERNRPDVDPRDNS